MEQSAKYVYEVYKLKSFSAAAQELYISQPALSAAVSRLEKELDIRIFDRTKQPITLTPQGRVYIEGLEEIMASERNIKRRLQELSDMSHGSLSIGGSSSASYYILSEICGAFYKKYPQIKVTLDIGNLGSKNVLQERLESGEIDLMLTYSPKDDSRYITELLMTERYVIAMRDDCDGAEKLRHFALTRDEIITGNYDKDREIEDMSVFKDIKFLDYGEKSIISKEMHELMGNYNRVPYKILNSRHITMHYHMMCAGVGAILTSNSLVAKIPTEAENILFFIPKSQNSYRSLYILRKHGSEENPAVKSFLEVANEVCR